MYCPCVEGTTIYVYMLPCIYMCLIVFNFVFSADLIEIGLNLTKMHPFWLLL